MAKGNVKDLEDLEYELDRVKENCGRALTNHPDLKTKHDEYREAVKKEHEKVSDKGTVRPH